MKRCLPGPRSPRRRTGGGLTAADDRGQATTFAIGVFTALWLFAGIVVDGGLALAGKARALDVAQEAARVGAQQVDLGRLRRDGRIRLVPDEAVTAAEAYVASTGDSGVVSVQGDTLTVRVVHAQRTQVLQLIGLRALSVHASGTAHAERVTP
jgi:Flp pilus assembly protein TadG